GEGGVELGVERDRLASQAELRRGVAYNGEKSGTIVRTATGSKTHGALAALATRNARFIAKVLGEVVSVA
ncbi:hypothetical protein, partial [Corallococcus sicarius]|uniref:hypothetical protein n=1 Tax=Corallococcus sicarius TaxID=2316726 RepID=UPI001ABF9E5C